MTVTRQSPDYRPATLGPLFDFQGTVNAHILTPAAPFQKHSPTSKAAAEQQSKALGVKQAAVLARIRSLGDSGATDAELTEWFMQQHNWSPNSARPRRIELVTLGRVVADGERRRLGSQVWIIAPHLVEREAA